MTATDSSRRGLWLAMAGLIAVPILAVVAVVSLMDDDERPKRRSLFGGASRETPDEVGARGGVMPGAPTDTAQVGVPAVSQPQMPPRGQESMAYAPAVQEPETTSDAGAGDPGDPSARIAESRRLENTDPERARALLREVLRDDPNNIVALERLSTKLLIDEDHAEAKRLAERCRGLARNATCDQISTLAVENSADVEKLAGAVKQCLAETPSNVGCLAGMVNYHLINGRVSDAAVYAGRLTQAAPQAPDTLYARARIKAAGGEYGEARQLFEWACQQGEQQACFRNEVLRGEGW